MNPVMVSWIIANLAGTTKKCELRMSCRARADDLTLDLLSPSQRS